MASTVCERKCVNPLCVHFESVTESSECHRALLYSVFLRLAMVSEPRTLHLGSDSFSVLKSELVFFTLPHWKVKLANPLCSLSHKGSSCKEETGWKVLRH